MKPELYNPLGLRGEVKNLAATACFVEIALHAGSWSAKVIEDTVRGGIILREKVEPTGGIQQLLSGRLPSNRTAEAIAARLPGCDIRRWRDHALWASLDRNVDVYSPIYDGAKRSLAMPLRQLVLKPLRLGSACAPSEPFSEEHVERVLVDTVTGDQQLPVFTAMTVLSNTNRYNREARCATLLLFPRVVVRCPHLYIRWEELLALFHRRVWRSKDNQEPFLYSVDEVRTRLLAEVVLVQQEGFKIPPDSLLTSNRRRAKPQKTLRMDTINAP